MNTKFLLSSDNNNRNELLKKKIIHYYIANGDATIADLGREMDLSIPTVTKLVAELQDDGYILDFGKQETNGGRKPNIYGLNPASGYFVGVDMLKDKLNIAAIDFKGDKVQLEENIPYQLENTPASLEQFCKIIDDFIVSLPVERNKILAIGVNITGRVNPASGYSYSIFYFEEKPLAQILEERLQTKVFIENDSRAMTYGEYMKGVVQGEKNILFVNMAWGLGLGIIIDGNLYYGKSGFSGELTVNDVKHILKKMYHSFDENYFIKQSENLKLPMNKKIKEFSTGMKAKLSVLTAMTHHAKLLIMDEPTAGLDVEARNEILDMLRAYIAEDESRSILITSHISTDLESLCDELYLIHDGKLILHEATDAILEQYGILKVSEEQYRTLDQSSILKVQKENYGYACFTNDKKFYQENYPQIAVENGGIDELILMMTGGYR